MLTTREIAFYEFARANVNGRFVFVEINVNMWRIVFTRGEIHPDDDAMKHRSCWHAMTKCITFLLA